MPESGVRYLPAASKCLPVQTTGIAIADVINIMPTTVPTPNTSRYAMAHSGLRIVESTNRATAAEPARP